MKKILFIIISLFLMQIASAQKEYPNLSRGSRLYEKKDYTNAELQYRNALLKNPKSDIASFNLGNSLYRQQKYDEACKEYEKVLALEKDKKVQAEALHNMGNCYLQSNDIQRSIEAYKAALKLNPNDNETRYNLAYANTLKKQQEQQQQNQDQKENMNKNDDQQKPENKPEDQNKQQMQNIEKDENQMTEDNAQRILDAFANDEKETQEKVNHNRTSNSRKIIEKDW